MPLTFPYRQHNYMGEHANDTDARTFIRNNNWDSNGNGTGDPQNGMWYYDSDDHKYRAFINGSWVDLDTRNALVDEDKIIYVGKHGSDTNGGKRIGDAVLTFTKALQLVNAETPSSSNMWGIVCLDGGIYAENVTFTDAYVHIFAASATIEGSVTILDNCSLEVERIKATSGTAIIKSTGTATAFVSVKRLETVSANGANNSSSGILNIEVEYYRQEAGVGLQGTAGITHADIQDWDLYGASPVAVKTMAGMTNLRSANIADRGGSGTSMALDCNGGTTNVMAVYISTDTCYDVESGATLNLIIANCNGTKFNDGTANVTTASAPAAHALGGSSHTADTLANLNALISDATLIDTGDSRLSDARTPTGAAGGDLGGTYPNPTVTNGVKSSATVDDNAVVRGDGGSRGIQKSDWFIDDNGKLYISKSAAGYLLDLHNSKGDGGGNGFKLCAGELLGDIALKICDADGTFDLLEIEADQGFICHSKTYAQAVTDHTDVYGFNLYNTGNIADFNTQFGNYRIGGKIQYFTPHSFKADTLDSPNSSDWKVNALAALASDSNNAALKVRRFDDTVEEGVGFQLFVPSGATEMLIRLKSRAETAPGSAQTVNTKLYNRGIPDNAAVEAWSAGVALASLSMPTNEYFQYDEETITLATLGVTANRLHQFELTRLGTGTLVGDWSLLEIEVEFH